MTGITFETNQQRNYFRKRMAILALQAEATTKVGLRVYRGSIINILKEWFPDIPRTRKSAYKYLVKKAPRNISYQRLLWISVGKKIWGVSQFRLADEHIRLYVLNPTKYSQLKYLLRGNLDGSTIQ